MHMRAACVTMVTRGVRLYRKVDKTPDSRRGRQFLPLILATARRAFQRKYALEIVLTEDVEVEERKRERA